MTTRERFHCKLICRTQQNAAVLKMDSANESIEIPELNFGEYMLDSMETFGDQTALTDLVTGDSISYSEASRKIRQFAAGLLRVGLKQGETVAIIMPNSVTYPLLFCAVTYVGGVFQPLNPRYSEDDFRHVFQDSPPKIIITIAAVLPVIKKALGEQTPTIVLSESEEGYSSLASLCDDNISDLKPAVLEPKTTTAALFLSSGTTGKPKAVQLGHYGLVANIEQVFASNSFPVGERHLVFLPMFHVYSLQVVNAGGLAFGAHLFVMQKFDFFEYLKLIGEKKIQAIHVVPPILVNLVQLGKTAIINNYDFSTVEKVFCGAAPLSAKVEEAVTGILKVPSITQGYAMTETGVTFCNRRTSSRPGSCGQALAQVECQILDIDTKEPLAQGSDGEVIVRGPQMALGYLNRPEETANMFRSDGWVYTGDIGHLDKDGFLFITDRLKELIKYKGFQVAPATLEDILLSHPSIADAAVIGIPVEEFGDLPKAFVVLHKGETIPVEEITDFVAAKVAPHMKLRGGVTFVSEIPKSASGKILRRTLKQDFISKMQSSKK